MLRAVEQAYRTHGAPPLVLVVPQAEANPEVRVGEFTLRVMENELSVDGRRIALCKSESDLLYVLLTRADEVVPFDELRAILRPQPKTKRGSLAVHIHALRRKIEADRHRPRHLLTIRFRGYTFRP